MAEKITGNMLIAQSGGPTVVINQSLVGAVLEAKKHARIKGIYGSLFGVRGILEENFVDLGKETTATLMRVARTPSSALGSVRRKPSEEDCDIIFTVLQKYDIRYFFYIGGNDSAETTNILNENARKVGYDFHCFHIPKTIDNDLRENDHTPGYGSAARFVACAVMGDNLDNRALPGVKINIVMGRHAGFLTAAGTLARIFPGDGPHLVYCPEHPFSLERFLTDVDAVYKKTGRCIICASEGISDGKGEPIISRYTRETDSHGNIQLSGSGALGDLLATRIKTELKISRVRADTFGYLQRSFPGVVSEVDACEAFAVGQAAVRQATAGVRDGSITIVRKPGKTYGVEYRRVDISKVARQTRHMPGDFISKEGNDVTEAFIAYAKPLVGKLPEIAQLKTFPVRKK